MCKSIRTFLVSLLILAISMASAWSSDLFEVGFAKVNVSPTAKQFKDGGIFLGGYVPFRPAKSIHDPIFARAMVIIDASGNALVTTTFDFPGISNQSIKRIRQLVRASTGIPELSQHIGATHTHSGPDLQGLWGGVTDEYRKQIEDLAAGAIIQAYEKRKPAQLFASKTSFKNGNRRGWGFSDQELTVLDAKSVTDGAHLGTMINFAAHPVFNESKSTAISRDFCGHVVDNVERALGGTAIFINGIVGDVTPNFHEGGAIGAQHFGEGIAEAAVASIPNQKKIEPSVIATTRDNWIQEVTNKLFHLAFRLGVLKYDMVKDGIKISIDVRPAYFRLGENLQGVAFPGEALTRIGLPIKAAMKSEFKLFLGLTGDTLGYFVPSDEWETGHNKNYEESVSLNKEAGDTARDTLIKLIQADRF